ncbi:MAG: DUF4115 domain-containing protein [Candidatus Doudnabacteria bacterium]|nr:DUF4115 domain-containing protein [Candidatus Doudnabacteria bacterium]
MNQLFQIKPVKIQTLAEHLNLSRQKLNLDIKTVSMLTQIKPSYIESLESGDWLQLPAEVYIKGFLKQLAELYRVREADLIDQFEKEHSFAQKSQTPDYSHASSSSGLKKIHINPKTLVIIVAAVLVLGVGTYISGQIRSVLAPPALEVTEPGSDINVSGTSIVITGRTEVGADVTINNQTVLVDKNGFFAENLVLSPGLNVIEVKTINKFGKESSIVRKVVAQVAEASTKLPADVNIVLEIGPESAWIYLEADGSMVHRGTMLPGSTKTVTAKKDILLTSANAGSTKIIYNGKDLGKLGRDGEVVRNVEFSVAEAK